jgi:hypothetical protein
MTALTRSQIKARYEPFPEAAYANGGYVLELAPMQQVVGDDLAYLIIVTRPDGIKVKSYYDVKTGLKIKQFTDSPGSTVSEFSDYREINGGVKIPFDTKTSVLGQPVEFKVTGAVANGGVGNEVFK